MKIQILSDTHNREYTLAKEADLIVHCGDFGNGTRGVFQFINKCKTNKKDFIFCLGNHDYYGENFEDVDSHFKEFFPENYLTYNNSIIKGDFTFVGGTFFTNFRENVQNKKDVDKSKKIASNFINDFRVIYYEGRIITPEDYSFLFKEYYENLNKYRGKENVIIVTHFPLHISCLDPKYDNPQDGALNPYFINDLDLTGFNLVLSGHTHTFFDHKINDTRIVVNPLGYPGEGVSFKSDFIIEV